jgi:hypothetical protein
VDTRQRNDVTKASASTLRQPHAPSAASPWRDAPRPVGTHTRARTRARRQRICGMCIAQHMPARAPGCARPARVSYRGEELQHLRVVQQEGRHAQRQHLARHAAAREHASSDQREKGLPTPQSVIRCALCSTPAPPRIVRARR